MGTNAKFILTDVLHELKVENYELIGNSKTEFSNISTIWDGKIDSIAFCSRKKVQHPYIAIVISKASVIIADKGIAGFHKPSKQGFKRGKAIVLVDNPKELYVKILKKCFPIRLESGIREPSSVIHGKAEIAPSVYIGTNCSIGKCKIGFGSVIHPNVVINDCVEIGKNVIINPGCVIGYDGFNYKENEEGVLENFPHYGGVVIEDDVVLGSNVDVNRGALGDTVIGSGTKIDSFCHIAHNVKIGKNVRIPAGVTLGGSVKIGDDSWIGLGSTILQGLTIGEKAFISIGSVVTKDVPNNGHVTGNFAIPHEKFIEFIKSISK